MNSHIDFGKFGENHACAFLKKQGYKILEINYRNVIGEIDIIAKDQKVLCFIEVKTRKSDNFGSPFEAVTPFKQNQIIKVAQCYIQENDLEDIDCRFDVVGIIKDDVHPANIELIKDAFEADG